MPTLEQQVGPKGWQVQDALQVERVDCVAQRIEG
jgi:hypothetical protein